MKLVFMCPVQEFVQPFAFLGVCKIRKRFIDINEPIESCKARTVSLLVNILLGAITKVKEVELTQNDTSGSGVEDRCSARNALHSVVNSLAFAAWSPGSPRSGGHTTVREDNAGRGIPRAEPDSRLRQIQALLRSPKQHRP